MNNDLKQAFAGMQAPSQLIEADPYLVAFSPTNPRKRRGLDVESMSALANSLKAQGLVQPILVRPLPGHRADETFRDREEGRPLPTYELVCGERRTRAARLAELATIPMIVRDLDDDAALELQLVENIEREDLDPIEEAEGFELLRTKLGYTVEQIAERIAKGKGASYVRKTMKLLALTPESRDAMSEGHLGRSTALLVAGYPAAQQAEVVEYIKAQAINGEPAPYRTVAPRVFTRFNLDLEKAVWNLEDADLVPAAGACSRCPKRSGANADLFPEHEGLDDSCQDAACFESKRLAHIEQVKARAQKDGFKVIDGDEARAAISSPFARYIDGYTRLDAVAYTVKGDDEKERVVTFEDALRGMGKKAPKPRILIHPYTGAAIKVITSELADKLQPEREEDEPTSTPTDEDERPPEEQALDDYQVRRAVTLRIFDAVRNRDRTNADMLLIAKALFSVLQDDPLSLLEDYLSWTDLADLEYGEQATAIHAKLDAMPPEELASVLTMAAVEISMTGHGRGFTRDGDAALAHAYGIDVLAVRDKVAEDLTRDDAAGQDEEA